MVPLDWGLAEGTAFIHAVCHRLYQPMAAIIALSDRDEIKSETTTIETVRRRGYRFCYED